MNDPAEIAQTIMSAIIMPVAFLGGLWRQVGIDPEEEAVEGIAMTFYKAVENPIIMEILSTYYTIALLSFIIAIITVTAIARIPGFIAFWVAYLGGFILVPLPEMGVLLLIVSWGLVLIGVAMEKKIKQEGAASDSANKKGLSVWNYWP